MNALSAHRPPTSVLLVDDHEDTRALYAAGLERAGFHVTAVEGGPQALALARAQEEFGIVVVDYSMPRMTGPQLARQLKATPAYANTRFILVTGHGPDALREGGRDGHFNAMVRKPVAPDHLARLALHVLQR